MFCAKCGKQEVAGQPCNCNAPLNPPPQSTYPPPVQPYQPPYAGGYNQPQQPYSPYPPQAPQQPKQQSYGLAVTGVVMGIFVCLMSVVIWAAMWLGIQWISTYFLSMLIAIPSLVIVVAKLNAGIARRFALASIIVGISMVFITFMLASFLFDPFVWGWW